MISREDSITKFKTLGIEEDSTTYIDEFDRLNDFKAAVYYAVSVEYDLDIVQTDTDIRGQIAVYVPDLFKGRGYNIIIEQDIPHRQSYQELYDILQEYERLAQDFISYMPRYDK